MKAAVYPLRRLASAFSTFKVALTEADRAEHFRCRECRYELSDAEAFLSKDEQREQFGEKSLLIRYPQKDCPACGAKYVPAADGVFGPPYYEPLYALPPKRLLLDLAWADLKDALFVRTYFAYPDGFRGTTRERIRRFWGRELSIRVETNPRALVSPDRKGSQ